MKRVFLSLALIMLITGPVFAQFNERGATIRHRNTVSAADNWFPNNGQFSARAGSTELKGYNSVRIDVDVTADSVVVVGNLAVSNDTLWVSGDALTFTRDSYQDVTLKGGSAYYFNVDSITGGGKCNVWLTPFNK